MTKWKGIFGTVNYIQTSTATLESFNINLEIQVSILIAKPSYNMKYIHDLDLDEVKGNKKKIIINSSIISMVLLCCTSFWQVDKSDFSSKKNKITQLVFMLLYYMINVKINLSNITLSHFTKIYLLSKNHTFTRYDCVRKLGKIVSLNNEY